MSFDNHYPKKKDWRKTYHQSKRFDRTCRPGGSCPYCRSNRLHTNKKRYANLLNRLKEYLNENQIL